MKALWIAALAVTGCHDFGTIKAGTSAGADATVPIVETTPSCLGRTLRCGTDQDSCCAAGAVPGGTFSRGYDTSMRTTQDGAAVVGWQERDKARAFVSEFALDKYEVTVGRFRPFYDAYEGWLENHPGNHDGAHPKIPTSGWNREWSKHAELYPQNKAALTASIQGCNQARLSFGPGGDIAAWLGDATGAHDQMPMTCVGFYTAMLFCIWDEGRLPTEAEWSFAAGGGDAQYAYPWGTPPAATFGVEGDRANVGPSSAFGLKPVGSFPNGAGRWGHLDLAGNVMEWVQDLCAEDCGSYNAAMASEPFELVPLGSRIVRGGSFRVGPVQARAVYRRRVVDGAEAVYEDTGWRCVRVRNIGP